MKNKVVWLVVFALAVCVQRVAYGTVIDVDGDFEGTYSSGVAPGWNEEDGPNNFTSSESSDAHGGTQAQRISLTSGGNSSYLRRTAVLATPPSSYILAPGEYLLGVWYKYMNLGSAGYKQHAVTITGTAAIVWLMNSEAADYPPVGQWVYRATTFTLTAPLEYSRVNINLWGTQGIGAEFIVDDMVLKTISFGDVAIGLEELKARVAVLEESGGTPGPQGPPGPPGPQGIPGIYQPDIIDELINDIHEVDDAQGKHLHPRGKTEGWISYGTVLP